MTNPLLAAEQAAIANQHVSFFGSFAQQAPAAFLSLNRLLLAHDITTIVEVGHHDGGLSTFFALYAAGSRQPAVAEDPKEPSLYKNHTHHKRPKTFYSFDNVLRDIPRMELCVALGTRFAKVDCFDPKVVLQIGGIIQSKGTTLVLCDGGDKVREVTQFAPYLKAGDFIMAHDWARDRAARERLRPKWPSWESWWSEGPEDAVGRPGLQPACDANGVVQVYAEEFDDVAWFCGRKGGA